jgi:hypothetical protein
MEKDQDRKDGKIIFTIFLLEKRHSVHLFLEPESLGDNNGVSSPKYNEIFTIISKLKYNKVAGSDNTSPEWIKRNGGRTSKQRPYKLI